MVFEFSAIVRYLADSHCSRMHSVWILFFVMLTNINSASPTSPSLPIVLFCMMSNGFSSIPNVIIIIKKKKLISRETNVFCRFLRLLCLSIAICWKIDLKFIGG